MFVAAFAVLGLSAVNAQEVSSYGFEEGNIIIEGSLGLKSTNDKNTETKKNGFVITPKVGYFISDDLAFGAQIGYESNKTEISGTDVSDTSTLAAGVFARYYFLELGQRFKTYTEFGVGFGTIKNNIGTKTTDNSIGAGLSLGMNYFLTENIAISFGLADILSFNSYKADGGKADSQFNANINLFENFFTTAQFGLTFKL